MHVSIHPSIHPSIHTDILTQYLCTERLTQYSCITYIHIHTYIHHLCPIMYFISPLPQSRSYTKRPLYTLPEDGMMRWMVALLDDYRVIWLTDRTSSSLMSFITHSSYHSSKCRCLYHASCCDRIHLSMQCDTMRCKVMRLKKMRWWMVID